MNNNELKEILELFDKIKTILDKEETEEDKSFKIKIPIDIKDYFVIDECGETYQLDEYVISPDWEPAYLSGATFKTLEECEQYDKERRLLFKIHKWAEEKNEGWIPDWNISKCNYYLLYDSEDKKLTTTYGDRYKEFSKLPCFKSIQLALECIDTFGQEIIEILIKGE